MSAYNPSTIPHPWDKDEILAKAYKTGWNHGHGIACHNVPKLGDKIDPTVDYVGLDKIVTKDNIREYHELLCYAAEQNSRSYTPFEFVAHEFNSYGNDGDVVSEELWEAFDQGLTDSIHADLQEYTDEDYGIEDED